jgi:hypothetical protein
VNKYEFNIKKERKKERRKEGKILRKEEEYERHRKTKKQNERIR